MRFLKALSLSVICALAFISVQAQPNTEDPSTWEFKIKKVEGNTYDLIFHVDLKDNWHIFALDPGGEGLFIPPSFTFAESDKYILVDELREEGTIIDEDVPEVGIIHYYKHADFIQRIKVAGNMKVEGTYNYMTCNDVMCLPPKTESFSFEITDAEDIDLAAEKKNDSGAVGGDGEDKEKNKSLLWLFLAALGGGILAVLTPCVYAMIPITVSFFTKRSKTRAEGLKNAFAYSLSIILIFTILGVLISVVFGANALNNLSTNWIANLFFFAVFLIFGISFLGAFEITLPNSWTNKTDSKAGVGSFGGIFFMALTLVIVSFSCTGPIVGPLLVLAGKGGIVGPIIGMFGFSVGLALPFALFAVFPGLLNKMAQSGGWLNQVKVTLGFIELMLALKFLSNADLAQGWRLLDREIFIVLWIVLAAFLGIYLLGKLKLSHDDESPKNIYGQNYVGLFRLFLAMTSFSFAVYLLPGLWGAPLNGMSQFLPPMGTFEQFGGGGAAGDGHGGDVEGVRPEKHASMMRMYEPPVVVNSGLVTFFDYEEALEAAKKTGRPVMLDFTGINCVNCRKMEAQVWSKPEVMRRLKEDYIVASLFCDFDRTELPEEQQFFSKELNAQIKTIGDYNEHLQAAKFGSSGQPAYYLVDENGEPLVDTEKKYGYDPDIQKFVDYLDKGLENYKNR